MKDPVLRAKEFKKIEDNRIHCVFWMFRRDVKLDKIKKLQKICNIIPIISMGDTFSKKDLEQFKIKISSEA